MEITCPKCAYSKDMDPGGFPPGAQWATCPECGHRFGLASTRPPPESPPSPPSVPADGVEAGIPWEDGRGSYTRLWWRTTKKAWFHPGEIFGRIILDGDPKTPLIYGLICGSAGFAFILFWIWAWVALAKLLDPWSVRGLPFGPYSLVMLVLILFSPVYAIVALYVWSGLQHLFLLIVRGAGAGFGGTFRVCCYASAGMAWSAVPFIGPAIGLVWSLVLSIHGLAKVHRIGAGRIVLAVFVLPAVTFILLLFLLVLGLAFFFGAI